VRSPALPALVLSYRYFDRRGLSQGRRSEAADLLDKLSHYSRIPGAFSGRDPFQFQALRVNPLEFQELPHECHSLYRHVITIQVMAVTDVSPAHKDAVSAFLESLQDLVRPNGSRTEGPNGPQVGRILQAAHPGKVCTRVRAPVTQESDDNWFELFV